MSHLINEGIISCVKEFIDFYKFICNELHVKSQESSVVLTESALTQSLAKEKIAEFLFESLQIQSKIDKT